ncbi:MAG: ABC transporter permease [Alphaproteobacteria bacterium]|nr:ABC transporter permease [Alphaproteobacteria bacterium]
MSRPSPRAVLAVRVVTVLGMWILWEAVARFGLIYEGVVPSSFLVLAAMARELVNPAFYHDVAVTAQEVIVGFAVGTACGIAAGVVLGVRRFADQAAAPYIQGLAATPKIIFLPILMLLFGVGSGSKMAIGAFSAFFPVVVATSEGMRGVNPVLVRVARSFNASSWQIARKIYLPSLVEPAITGMRLGLGVAIIGVLLAEIKFSRAGLGHVAIQYYNFFHVADMYAVLLITFALAVAANALMGALGHRLIRRR